MAKSTSMSLAGLENFTYHEVADGNGGGTGRPSKFSLRTVSEQAWAQSPNRFQRYVLGHWAFKKKQGLEVLEGSVLSNPGKKDASGLIELASEVNGLR